MDEEQPGGPAGDGAGGQRGEGDVPGETGSEAPAASPDLAFGSDQTALPDPSTAGVPPAPAEPARPADYWVRPIAAPAALLPPPRGRLRVLSVVTRSVDLFLQRPVPFLLIALPTAVISALGSILYLVGGGPQAYTPGVMPTIGPAAALGLVIGLIALVLGIALSLAMTMAADDVRAGRTVDVRLRFRQGLRRTGTAIVSWIAESFVIVGLFVGGALLVALLAVTRSGALVAVGFVALMIAIVWVFLRWALSTTAIALEPVGPLQALGRSRAVTRGNVWRIVAVYLLMGLIALPLGFGIGLLSLAINEVPILVLVLSAFASLATVPLFSIVSTTIFADLTGRPEAPRAPADARLRLTFVAGIMVVGVIALAVAIPRAPAAFERLALQSVPVRNPGRIFAGPIRNPFDPCQPVPGGPTLSSSQPIYIGGYFTKPIPRGETGTVEVFVNERLVRSGPLTDPSRSISCYAEAEPLVNATPARWRIEIHYLDETIAEGIFAVH